MNGGTTLTSAFTLDVRGNITAEQRNGSPYRTAEYTGNRLSTESAGGGTSRYLYDALGNVDCVVASSWASSSCPSASSGQSVASELFVDNVYDYRGRLLAVRSYDDGTLGDRTSYLYDPLGRPSTKTATVGSATTTTDFLYLGVTDGVVRETETGPAMKTRRYAFDALGQRATLIEDTARYSYVTDHRQSVEALLDQSNGLKAAYGYRAYGEANPSLTKTAAGFDASTNQYRYTGKRFDAAANVYDMGARHYSPTRGRWFQQDTYSSALANLGLSLDPLTQNRYQFTGANPINFIEVDGHFSSDVAMHDGGGPDCTLPSAATFPQCREAVRAEPIGLDDFQGAAEAVKEAVVKAADGYWDRTGEHWKAAGRVALEWGPDAIGLVCFVGATYATAGTGAHFAWLACGFITATADVLITAAVAADDPTAKNLSDLSSSTISKACTAMAEIATGRRKEIARDCEEMAIAGSLALHFFDDEPKPKGPKRKNPYADPRSGKRG
jgi:RHS repeat-associated protein